MRLPVFRGLRLRPTILLLFVLLTMPIFFTIVAANYFSNQRIARATAEELVGRFRKDAIGGIQNAFDPIKALVHSGAAAGTEQPDFYGDTRCLKYLFSILRNSGTILSAYVGLADSSFQQARRISPDVEIQGKLPPPGVRYAYRSIDPPQGAPAVDEYVFLDADEKEIGRSKEPTSYDPRLRPWYRGAVEEGGLAITDPDVFAALGLIGFTVAAPFYAEGKIAGVVAADITLEGLSEYLAERKISRGTLSYLLDSQGGVVANSERAKTYTNEAGRVELQHITSLAELPALAYSARPRHDDGVFLFTRNGEEYLASCRACRPNSASAGSFSPLRR